MEFTRRDRRLTSQRLFADSSQGMTHTAFTLAEVGADCLHRASKDWMSHPANGTEWALPAVALLVASLDAWAGEVLMLLRSREGLDHSELERLLYHGTLLEKYEAIPEFYGQTSELAEPPQLGVLVGLRHEVLHALPMPQGLPEYMRPLAERGLLLANTESAAARYSPLQLVMSYPLAYWAWNEANEACLALHHEVGLTENTSSYQLPVGLPVPAGCTPIRWHNGLGDLGEPPENRWESRGSF